MSVHSWSSFVPASLIDSRMWTLSGWAVKRGELDHQLRAGGVGQGDDLAEDGEEHFAHGGLGGEFAGVDGLDLCGGLGGVVRHELDEKRFMGGEDVPE